MSAQSEICFHLEFKLPKSQDGGWLIKGDTKKAHLHQLNGGVRALDLDRRTLNHNQTCHSQIPLMRGICLVPFYRTVRVGRLSEIDTAWQSTSKYAFRYPRECALFIVPSCLLRLFCLWYLFGWPSKWEKLPVRRNTRPQSSPNKRIKEGGANVI